MSPFFWLDTAAYGLSTVIAAGLALIVLASEPRRALNCFFALFALLEAVWACCALLLRLSLWLRVGNTALMLELSTLAFALMGPALLLFTARYIGRRTLWLDLAAVLGTLITLSLAVFLFRHEIIMNPRFITSSTTSYDFSTLGYISSLLPVLYLAWSLLLFWQERRRTREPFLALSVAILLAGLVGGGILSVPFPVMSITTTFSMAILGYGIVGRNILIPLRQRAAQLAALREIGLELSAQLDLDALLRSIVSRAVDLLKGNTGALYLHRPEREVLECVISVGDGAQPVGHTLRYGEGLSGRVWQSRAPIVVDDYGRWEGRIAAFEQYGRGAVVSVPITLGDVFLGVIDVESTVPRSLAPADADLLSLFAGQAAIAIRNVRLYEAARRRAGRLAAVNRISQAVRATLHPDDLLEVVYPQITAIMPADSFFIALYDEAADELDYRIQVDEGIRQTPERLSARAGLTSLVIAQKRPLCVGRLDESHGLPAPILWGTMKLSQSWLGVPMLVGERLIGVVCVQSYSPHAYGEEDELLLCTIADQVAVAVEQARLYQSLRDAEEKYRTLFAQANDAILVLTLDGTVLDANDRAFHLLGYDRDALLGMSLVECLPPQARARFPHSARELNRAGMRIELELVRKDGRRVPVDVLTSMLEVAGRTVTIAQVRDISERKRAEEELRLAQKLEAIGTLAGGVAHDFNNMLTGILGYASVAQQEAPAGSRLHADLGQIIAVAGRAADLTRQLLTFARRAPGVDMVPLDLNAVVREVSKLLERTIDKSVAIELNLAEDLRNVNGNAGQMQQTLLNLCLNARDAMPRGGRMVIETANVHWGAHDVPAALGLAPGDYAMFSVSDTGEGIAPEAREHIFEPFFTTKEQGRGLGLAIVYGIVREHGGVIHVYSEPGHGATFRVYLPAAAATALPAAPAEAPLPTGSETVLVVDDEAAVRAVLQRMLERGGYTVLLAADGTQGVETYRQQHAAIALVVLDVIMPGMSGREAYRRLREIDPGVRVLLSSGYSQNGQAAEILTAGAQGFLQKPYDLGSVLRKVRQVLDTT